MYTIAVTALVWVGVTGPQFDGDGFPLRDQAWVWVFPLLDGLLAMLALRRTTALDGARFQLMTLGFLLLGAGHAVIGWAAFDGRLEPGSWEAIAPAVGYLVIAAAIARPTGVEPTRELANVYWTQVFGLFIAALVPLGVLVLMLATDLASRSSSIVVSVATVAVIVLALARMWRLVHEVRDLSEQRGRDRLAAMVEHSSDVVMLADPDGRVNYASPGLRAAPSSSRSPWCISTGSCVRRSS
jgi:PAS domain-containing protein